MLYSSFDMLVCCRNHGIFGISYQTVFCCVMRPNLEHSSGKLMFTWVITLEPYHVGLSLILCNQELNALLWYPT